MITTGATFAKAQMAPHRSASSGKHIPADFAFAGFLRRFFELRKAVALREPHRLHHDQTEPSRF